MQWDEDVGFYDSSSRVHEIFNNYLKLMPVKQYIEKQVERKVNGLYKVKDTMSIKINSKGSDQKSHRIKIYYKMSKYQTKSFIGSLRNNRADFTQSLKQTKSAPSLKFCYTHTLNDIHSVSCSRIFSDNSCKVDKYHGSHYKTNPMQGTCWKVYRCQLSTAQESCCCSCNSDAMFEVMKSLYDCYKKKNCDNCNCILCGHLPREERRLGEMRKSLMALEGVSVREKAKMDKRKEKLRKPKIPSLKGKNDSEREKILKDLAISGVPLPEGKTKSEKEIIKKVKKELGLPAEPAKAGEREKLRKAEGEGLITPLEGKTAAEKEKYLKKHAALGIPLPEGRTASEKALIDRIKSEYRKPTETFDVKVPTEEKNLKKQATIGLPLPEGRTTSEKTSIAKIKSKELAALGLPSKMKIPSKKLRKAKAEGFLTPLEGKTPVEKEKILKGLAMNGIPLPAGETLSEKKIVDKVRKDVGLPPEPVTSEAKKPYHKAIINGTITPLEGKSAADKVKTLRKQAAMGLDLPEGRTPSERALITKIKSEEPVALGPPSKVKIPSDKLRKAKAEGLLTPLEDKTSEEKEKILKGLAMSGIPLPEGKTLSQKKLVEKIRKDVGLPPEPTTPKAKKQYQKAITAGIITPLEGKSAADKEQTLRKQVAIGLHLPEGRTPSEKALIDKVKSEVPSIILPTGISIPSAKLRIAKAEGLITPLAGKTPEQKKKILTGLAMNGIPLPEGKSSSEKKLIQNLRKDLGLPSVPEILSDKKKYNKAIVEGIITPLEGKLAPQKENILKKQAAMGLPLPEGRTDSEKALIAKVKADVGLSEIKIPSAKLRKAEAEGLLIPLEGKTTAQKEKILRGLATNGIPLPQGKTPSEKKLINKIRKDLRLPPEPDTSAAKQKYNKAIAAGIITPLKGKTASEKEKILRKQADLGLPLPEGRTASEKALVAKIRSGASKKMVSKSIDVGKPALSPNERKKLDAKTSKHIKEGKGPSDECICDLLTPESQREQISEKKVLPSEVSIQSIKLRKAKAEGLITPLKGKTPKEKERILKGLAMNGIPLPEGKTASEVKMMDKIRKDVGLPPEPTSPEDKKRYKQAIADGKIAPLKGKSAPDKEHILRKEVDLGLPLPEGRTPSEKALIAKVKSEAPMISSEKIRKAKSEGLFTPLDGKTTQDKERIIKGLAMKNMPLPEGKTASEKKLIEKIRKDLGLPPEPTTSVAKNQYKKALAAGIIKPLEDKSAPEKEKILRQQAAMGLPLPEGRTTSEKSLIDKIKADVPTAILSSKVSLSSAKLRKAKAEGLLTPLKGKKPEEKERILRGLAMNGIPLPEGKTLSEKTIIDKVREDVGLPPEPTKPADKGKYNKAIADGKIMPLEGKSAPEKERILKKQAELGLPLPEGRTPSEKALIATIESETPRISSAKLRKAKAEGISTPLKGKTLQEKEKILKGLAVAGIPFPQTKTASEKKLIDKVLKDVGLPPEPTTSAAKKRYEKALAAGIITPLEGKSFPEKEKILRKQVVMGLPLPEGRTASEKALIDKIKADVPTAILSSRISMSSAKLRKAKAEGLLTPLKGKTPEEKERILQGLAMNGIPLPEGKTSSEKKIIDKVRKDVGLPPEPTTPADKNKYNEAIVDGKIVPLEGKSALEKERILRKQAEIGIPLPEGRTSTEKALIAKIRASTPKKMMSKSVAIGKSALPPDQRKKLDAKTAKNIKESKGPSDECICGLLTPESQREGVSEKKVLLPSEILIPSVKFRKAQAEGLITPLKGKTHEEKEKIIKGLAMNGIPLPDGKTESEKQIIDKVRKDVGLPPEPTTPEGKRTYNKAIADGKIAPLEGKSAPEKERILRKEADLGLPLPEGRTLSEKAFIAKVKGRAPTVPSEKIRKSKAEGLLTPLKSKPPEEKEKIIKELAVKGIPLPEGKTVSEKKLIDKVRKDVGLPPEPVNSAEKKQYKKAIATGIITPLEGKSAPEKEKILRKQATLGLRLPEGRTPSEKALINKIKAEVPVAIVPSAISIPSAKLRRAKAEGLITPLQGKAPEEKERILKGLAMNGIPLPEGKTPSEKIIIDKIRKDVGLPPEPETSTDKLRYNKAIADGIIVPLEGKSAPEKERILKKQAELGVPLPDGRTPSEKALIDKIVSEGPRILTEKLHKAKAESLLTLLQGKTPQEKENIFKGLALQGFPLPQGKTLSDKELIDKVRKDIGLPPQPKKSGAKKQYSKALAAGIITPLEGKSAPEKEKILRKQATIGIPLPEGRTASEKALIDKIKAEAPAAVLPSEISIPSAKLRKAKAEGLITSLQGKRPEEKERILKGLAMNGIPLPAAKTASEKKMIDKIRQDVGLPPEPKTSEDKKKYNKAIADDIITPLEGKSGPEKERILKKQAELGLPLPEGRTPSENALIAKVKSEPSRIPTEKLRKAKAEGLLTPLKGKSPEKKEEIIKGLAMNGIPLPEGKTASEKKLIDKVRKNIGLPSEPTTSAEKKQYKKALAAGIITPLEGKSAPEKERILKKQAVMGLPLPEGRTASEKALIDRIKAEASTAVFPSEVSIPAAKLRKARDEGLLTPLKGKTPEEKGKILKGLAMNGIPLPEGKTTSEKKLIDRIRKDVGLPPVPTKLADKKKYYKAIADGIVIPLEGKSEPQKVDILKKQAEMELLLPEGRTTSEKALIARIKAGESKKMLPKSITVGKTALSPDQKIKLDTKTAKNIKEGKGPSDECICGLLTPESERERISEKKKLIPSGITSGKLKAAKAAGLLTPIEGKKPAEKERIIRGLAKQGLPFPEPQTTSDKMLIDKVRAEMGLPPEPTTRSVKEKYAKAQAAGLITPLEGKTPSQKEQILTKQARIGLPLPEGRTPSEKALINKVKVAAAKQSKSDKLRKAKEAGLLTPLEKKSPKEKEKIIQNLIKAGLPLPEGKTSSEKQLIKKVKADMGLPSEDVSSEKIRKAKSAGIITTLEDKTPAQKEKILKGRVAAGLPLPEGETPYDKELIRKVKVDTGYISPIIAEKMRKAGLLTPLEGKTPSQKEKILRNIARQGLALPQPRTSSDKALISKIKSEYGILERKTPSEKLRQAKAAGFLTPLEGKTSEQQEKILKGLAKAGLPLPEGKTPAEKDLINKVRQDLGLPPEPKTPSLKEKMQQAHVAGIITPLEGKSPSQKEKVLRKMHDAGVALPEGRTPSEKALIKKIESEPTGLGALPSEKIRKAKAEGLLTPLEGKTLEQQEKILKGLAKAGLPLPDAKTSREKALINKVRHDLGLPPEPKTPSMKEKIHKAQAAGIITPLAGKSPSQKEKILRKMYDAGVELPAWRSSSEKKLVKKIQSELRGIGALPSEKVRKAKAEGLLTPLEGKTPEHQKKILKGLVKAGIPLPEGKTPAEKDIINKVRQDLGLPPESKTPSMKEKMQKAQAAGIITPLEGKSAAQKRKTLEKMHDAGIPLPEGRTSSEKALIKKVKLRPPGLRAIPSEKIRKVKAKGLLTPLEGKTSDRKEEILKGLAMNGIPLPEGKTPSEKKLADKVRASLGLPKSPKSELGKQKYNEALAAGVITPLEGKTSAQKEEILKNMAAVGLLLPEGRTSSEKSLIAKVKAISPSITEFPVSAEKLKKAKAAGLLTPLAGKSPKEKEKILKGLAMHGIPLPEGKTPSEKKLIDKLRSELGLPQTPKTQSQKEKYGRAFANGLMTPLEGKTPSQKEKILRDQVAIGLALPKGRTPSEKALVDKIKKEALASSEVSIPSEKIRKARAAGLLTPLEGKAPEKKEQILRSLAEAGLPLPQGKSASDKSMIRKIKAEYGIPPKAKTPSEKEKSPVQKEKILKGLAEAGLPIPEGTTPSEKSLIKKIRATAALPPEPTTSEKRSKVRTKSKKIGDFIVRKSARGVGVAKAKAGVVEEFEDIIKTTTCDKGCGCDKKKIRFKHSYVKIRVTSPDISSLCPCPDECVPGVKGGVFTDSEGIKVTVGRVGGISAFPSKELNDNKNNLWQIYSKGTLFPPADTNNFVARANLFNKDETEVIIWKNDHKTSIASSTDLYGSSNSHMLSPFISKTKIYDSPILFGPEDIIVETYTKDYCESKMNTTVSSGTSLQSIYIINTESSLSFSPSTNCISVISFSATEESTTSCKNNLNSTDNTIPSYNKLLKYFQMEKYLVCASTCSSCESKRVGSSCFSIYDYSTVTERSHEDVAEADVTNNHDVYILRVTESGQKLRANDVLYKTSVKVSSDVMDEIKTNADIMLTLQRIISKESFSDSSLVIIVPTSSDDRFSEYSTATTISTICIQLSENSSRWQNKSHYPSSKRKQTAAGLKMAASGKTHPLDLKISHELNDKKEMRRIEQRNMLLQTVNQANGKGVTTWRVVTTDTTEDRPCCCLPKQKSDTSTNCVNGKRVSSVLSEVVHKFIAKEFAAQGMGPDILDTLGKNTIHSSLGLFESTSTCQQTPVRLCKVPPCRSSSGGCNHRTTQPSSNCTPPDFQRPYERVKQMISTGCGNSISDMPLPIRFCKKGQITAVKRYTRRTVKLPQEPLEAKPQTLIPQPKDTYCRSCNVSPNSSGKTVKISDKSCPCEVHNPPNVIVPGGDSTGALETSKSIKFKSCECKMKSWRKTKNNICECPEEPEPEPEPELYYDPYLWIDERKIKKMKSDLTQTTSGFKFDIKRRRDDDLYADTWSFEDALKYFADHPEEGESIKKINKEMCTCDGTPPKKYSECECPDKVEGAGSDGALALRGSAADVQEPFNGIKFRVEGKGSGSKGLDGILCFELLYNHSNNVL